MKKNSNLEQLTDACNKGDDNKEVNKKTSKSLHNAKIPQLSFDNFSTVLSSINLISNSLTNEHKICLEFPSIEIDIENVVTNDFGVNVNTKEHKYAFQSSLSSYDINVYTFFSLYKALGQNDIYTIEDFKILIQILTSILSTYNDVLFHYDLSKDLFSEKIHQLNIFSLKDIESKQVFHEKIRKMYDSINTINDMEIRNLFFLVSVFTLFGALSYKSFTIETLMNNIDLYNSIIISDFKLFILIHCHIVIFLNITLKKLPIDQFLSLTHNNKSKQYKSNSNSNKINGSQMTYGGIPTIFYIDHYSLEQTLQNSFQHMLISCLIKLHLLTYIQASSLNCSFNLAILSFESIRWITMKLSAVENQIKFNKDVLLHNEQFIKIMNCHTLNDFNIIYDHSFSPSNISCILSAYLDLIIKSKLFNAETEPINKELSLTYDDYIAEIEMILGVLKFNLKLKNEKNKKKASSRNYSFRFAFNAFSITTRKDLSIKENHIRDMLIFFNQKRFSEEDFINHLSKRGGLPFLYANIRKIFSQLQYFKKYSIGIRLSQYTIINDQLQFYFHIIYLQMHHYLLEHQNSHKRVVLHELDHMTPQTTIVINNSIKHKEKLTYYDKYIKKFELGFISILNQYVPSLFDLFSDIIIHYEKDKDKDKDIKNQFNPRVLLRNYSENILIIITNAISIDFIIYMHEGDHSKDCHEKIIDWIQIITLNPGIANLIHSITLVVNKQCLADQDYYNTDAHLKRFISDVTTLYIIDKEYDLVLQERRMIILNRKTEPDSNEYMMYVNIIKKSFDMMQYVMDNQLRFYNNFAFVSKEYIFQFKNGCFTIRKLTVDLFDSLLAFDPLNANNSYPIINMITIGKISDCFSLINLLKIFKEHYLKMEEVTEFSVVDELQCRILSNYFDAITVIIFKEKYYKKLIKLFPTALFKKLVIYPIKLKKIQHVIEHDSLIAKEITLLQFENTKLNFYSKNDMGRMFSLGKTMKSLENIMHQPMKYIQGNKGKKRDEILMIIWVLKQKIHSEKYGMTIRRNIIGYLIDFIVFNEEINEERYVIDFNIVANEVRKYKKKMTNKNKGTIENTNENKTNKDENEIISCAPNHTSNEEQVNVIKQRSKSGMFGKKINKNCIIY